MKIFLKESLYYVIQYIASDFRAASVPFRTAKAPPGAKTGGMFGRFFPKSARKLIHGRWNSVPKISHKPDERNMLRRFGWIMDIKIR